MVSERSYMATCVFGNQAQLIYLILVNIDLSRKTYHLCEVTRWNEANSVYNNIDLVRTKTIYYHVFWDKFIHY